MTREPVIDKARQELWEHKGRHYSIINLIIPPLEDNGTRAGGNFTTLMYEMYHPNIYELAELTHPHIDVLGQFKSPATARKYIKERTDV